VDQGGVVPGLRLALSLPAPRLGLVAIALAHTTMVSVMVMTPIHMDHGGASLQIIGLVISGHVAGMFAFSPVMGWLADRMGHAALVGVGGVLLVAACTLAALSPEGSSPALGVGLLLLGLGWSAIVVAGSTLLMDGVPLASRVQVQGASDVVMNLSAAAGGALAGLVVAGPGFGALAVGGAVLAAVVVLAALGSARA
jgi:MFS family permease